MKIRNSPVTNPTKMQIDRLDHLVLTVGRGGGWPHGEPGPMSSIYLRDPDGNLVEISAYPK
jgi:catechol 2,3-dioxygenase-like lactoylglutathione lyase family enzyme